MILSIAVVLFLIGVFITLIHPNSISSSVVRGHKGLKKENNV